MLKFVFEILQHTVCANLILNVLFSFSARLCFQPNISVVYVNMQRVYVNYITYLMRDGYGFMLSEPQRTITNNIGWLLYDWNNGILLKQNQHKRIHKTPL